MRAADADREKVADRLRHALAEGRITLDELDERLKLIYAARTFGELDRAVEDLPDLTPEDHSQVVTIPSAAPSTTHPPSRVDPPRRLPVWLAWVWRAWALAVLVNLTVWFLVSLSVGSLIYFWPMWVAGPWAAVNVGLMFLFPPRPQPPPQPGR